MVVSFLVFPKQRKSIYLLSCKLQSLLCPARSTSLPNYIHLWRDRLSKSPAHDQHIHVAYSRFPLDEILDAIKIWSSCVLLFLDLEKFVLQPPLPKSAYVRMYWLAKTSLLQDALISLKCLKWSVKTNNNLCLQQYKLHQSQLNTSHKWMHWAALYNL